MMEPTPLYTLCLSIAEAAHKGQRRKDGITPYIEHPKAVERILSHKLGVSDERLYCVALLHDTIEDTGETASSLKNKGVPYDIIRLVDILTRRCDETYFDYLMRVLKDEDASTVKYADLEHNISDLQEGSLKDKYRLAQYIIKEKWW